jgi:fermentation-respiration switch protein FrsA (DUF1100 family)
VCATGGPIAPVNRTVIETPRWFTDGDPLDRRGGIAGQRPSRTAPSSPALRTEYTWPHGAVAQRPDRLGFIVAGSLAELRLGAHRLIRLMKTAYFATDNTVGIANASEIFRAARHPRSFVSLEGGDHLLTGKNQAARAARIISAWADPYL